MGGEGETCDGGTGNRLETTRRTLLEIETDQISGERDGRKNIHILAMCTSQTQILFHEIR